MTNVEKAKELCNDNLFCDNNCPKCIYKKDFLNLLEIAEWKDAQFAEEKKLWIEKVCNFLENRNVLEKDCSILASGMCSITFHPDNLVDDLKQAMEEY